VRDGRRREAKANDRGIAGKKELRREK